MPLKTEICKICKAAFIPESKNQEICDVCLADRGLNDLEPPTIKEKQKDRQIKKNYRRKHKLP